MSIYFRSAPVSEPLTFDSIGNHWLQESVSRPNGFPLYHYLQTETGCGKVNIQGKEYLLEEGQGILIAPSVRHFYVPHTTGWSTLFATFTGTIQSDIGKILGNRSVIFIEKDQGMHIAALVSHIVEKYKNLPIDTKSVSIDCYSLLMHFVDGIQNLDLLKEPLYLQYVEPIIKEIETHYDQPLTVAALSQLVYVTPQYLSRLFHRFLGCSAYEYLTNYRMNRAKEFLLITPRLEVQEVSRRTGFQDTSHFIAMFKKVTGRTPLEFRRLN